MVCKNKDAVSVESIEWILNWEFLERVNNCSLWTPRNSQFSDKKSIFLFTDFYGSLLNIRKEEKSFNVLFKSNSPEEHFYQTPIEYIYSGEGFLAILNTMHSNGYISSHSKLPYTNEWTWEFSHKDGYHGKQQDENFYSACYRAAIQSKSEQLRLEDKS